MALESSSNTITVDHLKSALHGVEILDNRAKTIILGFFKEVSIESKALFIEENITTAKEASKINYSDELKAFKEHMESHGYQLGDRIAKLVIKVENQLSLMREQITTLKETLENNIFDQNVAIEAIADAIVESKYRDNSDKPKGIFFFLGPPATGKTYLASILSDALGSEYAFKKFDMTQYTDNDSGGGLFGIPEEYKGAREGALTSFVKKNSKSIIVLDEIEKAHSAVMSNFLEVLSIGSTTDVYTEKKVDFQETMLIFTSNLGKELYSNQRFVNEMQENTSKAQSTIIEAISREKKSQDGSIVPAITPEMLSRLSSGAIILFNKLALDSFVKIARNEIIKTYELFEKTFGVKIEFIDMDHIITLLVLSFAPIFDARRIKANISRLIFDRITDYIIQNSSDISKVIIVLNSDSKKQIRTMAMNQSKNDNEKLLHLLFRKNETIHYSAVDHEDNGVLRIEFSDVKQKKLPKPVDFSGEGALTFEIPEVNFENDVAGHHDAKARLLEVSKILINAFESKTFCAKPPRGMLMYGPPGTGKTLLAKAFANEAGFPFISTTGTEIMNPAFMKTVFKRAREYAPSIIFIDEMDGVGRRNGSYKDELINQLLTEINGFSDQDDEQVFIIAATNFKEKIDPALLRSGRIDLHVKIDYLDKGARAWFIDRILKHPLEGDVDRDKLVLYTASMTGADLAKVEREVTLYAIRNDLNAITEQIIIEQINTIKYGERIKKASIEELMEETAYHEAGHAVLSKVLMPHIEIEQITVVPRRNALGFVSYNQESKIGNLTREEIKNKICVAFAGRLAQKHQCGESGIDSGASSDLAQASNYAYHAIAVLGMDEVVGYINTPSVKKSFDVDILQEKVQTRVQTWMMEAKEKTEKLIEQYWDEIDTLAKRLIENEIVHEDELNTILQEK